MRSQKYVYWEKQGNDRMCGLHCINSILQGPYYTPENLAEIGKELDEQESEFLKCHSNDLVRNNSTNVLEDGFINISVIIECLKRMNICLKNVSEEDLMKIVSNDHHQDIGYICNLEKHWFSIRKIYNNWYVLDSLKSNPLYIKDMKLKFYFNDIMKKYHIFSVQNENPYISLPKPDISFTPSNPNQLYVPTNQINEITEVSGYFLDENRSTGDTTHRYLLNSKDQNEQRFKWPDQGGRKLNEASNTNNQTNEEVDSELEMALQLSLHEYIENLKEPPEDSSNENTITIMVKFPKNKIQKKFSITRKLSDLFYWIEYETAKKKVQHPVLCRKTYSLIQAYPRQKFIREEDGSINLQIGDKIEPVHDQTLQDLKFEQNESFIVS